MTKFFHQQKIPLHGHAYIIENNYALNTAALISMYESMAHLIFEQYLMLYQAFQ